MRGRVTEDWRSVGWLDGGAKGGPLTTINGLCCLTQGPVVIHHHNDIDSRRSMCSSLSLISASRAEARRKTCIFFFFSSIARSLAGWCLLVLNPMKRWRQRLSWVESSRAKLSWVGLSQFSSIYFLFSLEVVAISKFKSSYTRSLACSAARDCRLNFIPKL